MRTSAKVAEKHSRVFRKPLTYIDYITHFLSRVHTLWWKSFFTFVSQLLFSSLRPISWNPLWRKDILNNFRAVIKEHHKSVMVDLLALLLGNPLQCKMFCALQVGVLLSSLAQLKGFARKVLVKVLPWFLVALLLLCLLAGLVIINF